MHIAILLVMITSSLVANMIIVNQDGSGDFVSIQTAIDSAVNNDTILVYPGNYYETLDFLGKSISLMSLAIATGDDSYIEQTVIDAGQIKSAVTIVGSETAYIGGFTITNGYSRDNVWGGDTMGGGLAVVDSGITIENNVITRNWAEWGGGISLADSDVILKGNIIFNNSASSGGGLDLVNYYMPSEPTITFCPYNKNSIYSNMAGWGNDIFTSKVITDIVLEYASVDEFDTYFYEQWSSELTLDVEEVVLQREESDLYVAPWGSDDNSGLSSSEPLQRISYALLKIKPDSLEQRTIHIAEGLYSPSVNGELLPLSLQPNIKLKALDGYNWTVDGDGLFTLIFNGIYNPGGPLLPLSGSLEISSAIFQNGTKHAYVELNSLAFLSKLTMKNVLIRDMQEYWGDPNLDDFYGLRISRIEEVDLSDIRIEGNLVSGGLYIKDVGNAIVDRADISRTTKLPGIRIGHSNYWFPEREEFTISNSKINNAVNTISWPGGVITGGISIVGPFGVDNPEDKISRIINCTIADNISRDAAVVVRNSVNANFYNTIVYGNNPNRLIMDGRHNEGYVSFSHCLFENGMNNVDVWGSMYNVSNENILSGDPLFVGDGEHPYQLSDGSPAINAGTMDIPDYEFPEYDLAGNARINGNSIDIGAYEYHETSAEPQSVSQTMNVQVRPNPVYLHKRQDSFYCTISFNLPISGDINVDIYNIKGQKVRTLLDTYMTSGMHNIRWDGMDNNGTKVSSGVYLYKISNSYDEKTGRVIILK